MHSAMSHASRRRHWRDFRRDESLWLKSSAGLTGKWVGSNVRRSSSDPGGQTPRVTPGKTPLAKPAPHREQKTMNSASSSATTGVDGSGKMGAHVGRPLTGRACWSIGILMHVAVRRPRWEWSWGGGQPPPAVAPAAAPAFGFGRLGPLGRRAGCCCPPSPSSPSWPVDCCCGCWL